MLNNTIKEQTGNVNFSFKEIVTNLNLPQLNSGVSLSDFSTPNVVTETIDLSLDGDLMNPAKVIVETNALNIMENSNNLASHNITIDSNISEDNNTHINNEIIINNDNSEMSTINETNINNSNENLNINQGAQTQSVIQNGNVSSNFSQNNWSQPSSENLSNINDIQGFSL